MNYSPSTAQTPRFARGVRLHEDAVRGEWILLAPERVLKPDAVGLEILRRVSGTSTLSEIVDDLAHAFTAPRERIEQDVRAFLDGLAEKGLVEYVGE